MPTPTLDSLTPGVDPASAIRRAKEIAAIKARVNQLVGANREQLRNFDLNDALDQEQGAWLDTFYPQKERGANRDPDSVTATRKAHEAAIKEVTASSGNAQAETPAPAPTKK